MDRLLINSRAVVLLDRELAADFGYNNGNGYLKYFNGVYYYACVTGVVVDIGKKLSVQLNNRMAVINLDYYPGIADILDNTSYVISPGDFIKEMDFIAQQVSLDEDYIYPINLSDLASLREEVVKYQNNEIGEFNKAKQL